MTEAQPLLRVSDLQITARHAQRERTIVSGIELTVAPGETIGIVGESGSGKSVTARALIGLLPTGLRAQGTVEYRGRDLLSLSERSWQKLRGTELGLVFQDPFTMLSPVRRCGRHIDELLRDDLGHRMKRRERRLEAVRRLAEVGIRDPHVADRYPFELSGGMRQRVGIAAVLARNPKLLIADEPSTALDVTTQREILWLLKSLQESRGMSLIMITHDLRIAFAMCDRIYVLYAGSMLEVAPARALEQEPRHPYTLGLLLSEPPLDRRLASLPSIKGSVPAPDSVAGQCTFAERCQWAAAVCRSEKPPIRSLSDERASACVRAQDIRSEMADQRKRSWDLQAPIAHVRDKPLLLETRNVFKVFERKGHQVIAVNGVSIEVGENESVGLVGESGSGKTTLGRCLVGLETPTAGEITIDDIDASEFRSIPSADLRRLRATVQVIFQDPYSSLNPVRTIGSTVGEVLDQYSDGRGDPEASVPVLLRRVGLPSSYAARKPVSLSGGERQRVAIARALAVRPRLLICDEPVSSLDVSVQAQILNLFADLREELGMSYLFITHDLAVVRQVVERVYVLYKGEVVEQGPVDDVLDAPKHEYTKRLVAAIPRTDRGWLLQREPLAASLDAAD